jgi:hypothetical protein
LEGGFQHRGTVSIVLQVHWNWTNGETNVWRCTKRVDQLEIVPAVLIPLLEYATTQTTPIIIKRMEQQQTRGQHLPQGVERSGIAEGKMWELLTYPVTGPELNDLGCTNSLQATYVHDMCNRLLLRSVNSTDIRRYLSQSQDTRVTRSPDLSQSQVTRVTRNLHRSHDLHINGSTASRHGIRQVSTGRCSSYHLGTHAI